MNFDKPQRNGEHPTMKPVDLFAYQIENNTKAGNVVLDLFGGSGTTIIACEQLGRRGYAMELDPRYVDVIVKRYIGVTGKTDVVLLRDGEEIPVEETGILD
jgi:site-specific DNA-methyltransferase (adenine-specific)